MKTGSTLLNRLNRKNKISNIFRKYNTGKEPGNDDFVSAYSLGNIFNGNYLDEAGNVYSEKSTTLEIAGVDTKILFDIAEEIAVEFKQESVLVKDYNKNKIYLVNSDKTGSYDLDTINIKV